jgi:RNA polymerase sigma factor (TIGR02999 family)
VNRAAPGAEDEAMGADPAAGDVSRILRESPVRMDRLLPLVYEELRAIAKRRMAGERPGHTLGATALVHEAYLRLLGSERVSWRDQGHFFGAAAEAMRRILIDHARTRGREKRGGGRRAIPLDVLDLAAREDPEEILSLDEAVRRLEEQDARMASIVKLRFFAGLSEEETASALGVAARTVRREWALARAFLQREIER